MWRTALRNFRSVSLPKHKAQSVLSLLMSIDCVKKVGCNECGYKSSHALTLVSSWYKCFLMCSICNMLSIIGKYGKNAGKMSQSCICIACWFNLSSSVQHISSIVSTRHVASMPAASVLSKLGMTKEVKLLSFRNFFDNTRYNRH
jgi:hypothetical protein